MHGTREAGDKPGRSGQVDYTPMTVPDIVTDIQARRDRKLAPVVAKHLPAWIVQERINTSRHVCTFDLVFRPATTWLRRRYTYDAEVDVLHYRGEETFDEATLGELSKELLVRP